MHSQSSSGPWLSAYLLLLTPCIVHAGSLNFTAPKPTIECFSCDQPPSREACARLMRNMPNYLPLTETIRWSGAEGTPGELPQIIAEFDGCGLDFLALGRVPLTDPPFRAGDYDHLIYASYEKCVLERNKCAVARIGPSGSVGASLLPYSMVNQNSATVSSMFSGSNLTVWTTS